MDILTRFLSKVDKAGPVPAHRPDLGPCWLWIPVPGAGGYCYFAVEGKNKLAHRVSHELFIGPIPEGMTIDHLCRVRSCVRPTHFEVVTRAENVRRAKSWLYGAALQRDKTHCPKKHAYSGDNLRICADGRRACRQCAREQMRDRRAAAKAAAAPAPPPPPATHCWNGHEYAVTGWVKSGKNRMCGECSRIKVRAYRERQAAANPRKPRETCKYGHKWITANIYVNPRGQRSCRPCHNDRTNAAYHARKAAEAASESTN